MKKSPPTPKSGAARGRRTFGRHLARAFLNGVLIVAPVAITLSILHWLLVSIDGWLDPFVQTPGLGILGVLLGVLIVGWIGSLFLINRILAQIDAWLERLPGVNFIYSSVRDFIKAFVGNKRRFHHTVLVRIFADDVWMVGFLTDENPSTFKLEKGYVSVYVPQAYNVGGQLYLLPPSRVRSVEHLSASDAMKYAATGGAVDLPAAKDASA